jgi:hypothetical protein
MFPFSKSLSNPTLQEITKQVSVAVTL